MRRSSITNRGRFIVTIVLLLLLEQTARADWPIVRYINGTVGITSDYEVHIQTERTQVNGRLNVTGELIANDVNVTALKPPTCMRPRGKGLFFDGNSWICECANNYFGRNCDCTTNTTHSYNTATSTCEEKASYAIINGKTLYQDSEGWILLLAYNHKAGESNSLVSKTAPISPFQGYSHIWLEDLRLTANDVDGVKFFCNTSAHARVVHFSMNNEWIKSAIVTGSTSGNAVSYWTSGTTKFSDHTGILPDASENVQSTTFFEFPFSKSGTWALSEQSSRWECDDVSFNAADTLHQIWFRQALFASSTTPSSDSTATAGAL